MLEKWKLAANESTFQSGFVFCPKFPQVISHERMLVASELISEEFVNAIFGLEEFLGMAFLQLPPAFSPEKWPVLERYLKSLPDELNVAVEFRHPDWFKKTEFWQHTLEKLHNIHKHGVITDVAGRRDVLHMGLSSPILTLRFIANEGHKSDYVRTDAWVQRLKSWFEKGFTIGLYFCSWRWR